MSVRKALRRRRSVTPTPAPQHVATPDTSLEPDAVDEALLLRLRYESDPRVTLLNEAEQVIERAIRDRAERGEPAGYELAELAQILRYRYAHSGESEDLRSAVEAQRRSVDASAGDPAEQFRRALLAGVLVEWFQAGHRQALDEAASLARAVLRAVPWPASRDVPGGQYCSQIYQTCSAVLCEWAEQHDDRKVLAQAAKAARAAVAAGDAEDRSDSLAALAEILWSAFGMRQDPRLLNEAISAGEQAVAAGLASELAQPGTPAHNLGALGIRLVHRSQLTSDPADAEKGAQRIREALDLLPDGHRDQPMHLTNLGIALHHLHGLTDDSTLLDKAVHATRAAVAGSIPDFHKALRLSNLGGILSARYDRTGDLADLDEAIDCLREAVGIAEFDVSDASAVVKNLGLCLNDRYDRLGTRSDLEDGIQALREAAALERRTVTVPDTLAALGGLLRDRFDLLGDAADLAEAKRHFRKGVARSHRADPALVHRLNDYAIVRREDGTRAGPRAAVRLSRRALRLAPAEGTTRAAIQSQLALALCMRDRRGDLDRALAAAQEAVAATPEDQASYVGYLTNLVFVLDARRAHARYPDPETEATAAIAAIARTAALNPAGWPDLRVNAASLWGWLSRRRGEVEDAAEGYTLAVQLLSELSPRRLVQTDAQRHLSGVAGLAGVAAASQLTADRPELALSVLELGRGVLLNRVVGARADTGMVRDTRPKVAERFEGLREQLDRLQDHQVTAATPPTAPAGTADSARALAVASRERDRRRDLTRQFEQAIDVVREDPQHVGFLRPPKLSELLEASADGPVVLVNTSPDRSDALLLTPAGLRTIPLPEAGLDEANRHALLLQESSVPPAEHSEAALAEAQEVVAQSLDWLWSAVARPVLRSLADLGMPQAGSGPTPRLWWVPTQSLCFLPLHAATDRATGESTLDHYVSSYSPTVTALMYARRRRLAMTREAAPGVERSVVLAATAAQEGAQHLPAAVREADDIARLLGTTPLNLSDSPEPALKEALAQCAYLHVAMHAFADLDDPSQSRFSTDGVGLPFSELIALHNQSAQLAFLSACETTATSHTLADEAIHLSTAIHLAGFPEVIGTQRRVPDLIAEYTAKIFYAQLLHGSPAPSRLEPGAAALALHRTALILRRRYRGQPSAWCAYHHIGA